MDLRYRVVVVVGGARGVGRAVVMAMARRDARVVIVDRDWASAEAVAAATDGTAIRGDLTIPADLISLIGHVEQRVGPIDLFCWCETGDIPPLGLDLVVPDMARRGTGWVVAVPVADGSEAPPNGGATPAPEAVTDRGEWLTAGLERDAFPVSSPHVLAIPSTAANITRY